MAATVLARRIVTALILIALVVAAAFYLSTPILSLVFAAVVMAAGMEWTHLAGIRTATGRWLFLVMLGAALGLVAWLLNTDPGWAWRIASAAVLWWILVTIILFRYRPGQSPVPGTLAKSVFGWLVLVPAWTSLVVVHGIEGDGPSLLLFLLVLTWVADSGAYFSGSRWGKTKLAPDISPGKSREGVYGALAGAAACGLFLAWWRPETGGPVLMIIFCLALTLISVVGDLFESLLKRQAGVKDSGSILPGHGGVLDRIDSLTAAAPLFLAGLLMSGQ